MTTTVSMTSPALKPDFLIIGAIKSGTTWLAHNLYHHPQVFMPGTWEPEFYATDLILKNAQDWKGREDEYYALFRGAKEHHLRKGEKSVFYLYSKAAVENIKNDTPEAKLICILRNPVDLIWSLYRYNLANLEEDQWNFERALELEDARKEGEHIPDHTTIVNNLFYRDVARFSLQIHRYLTAFDRSQLFVETFDNFKKDPKDFLHRVQRFLAIAQQPPIKLSKVNPTETSLAHIPLRKFLVEHPAIKRLADKTLTPAVRTRIKSLLKKLPKSTSLPQHMPAHVRTRLCAEFSPDIERLEDLLKIDLSAWKE